MPSVAAASSTNAAAYTDDTTQRTAKKTLGQDDFLRLLTTQMTNQDPMNPISDTNQIAQLAQFSSLQSMNSLLVNSQLAGASNMIGRNVSALSTNGKLHSGVVDSVQVSSGKVYVNIGGEAYEYTSISQVKPAETTAATNTGTTPSS